METNQIKLLNSLLHKLKHEHKDKESAIKTLNAAKILTKNGEFTKQYSNLNRIVTPAK